MGVLGQKLLEMARTEDDDMVEQLASDRADPSLGDSVLPWAPSGDSLGFDLESLDAIEYVGVEEYVAVQDQIAWRRVEGKCLPQLPANPVGVGRLGDCPMDNLTAVVVDEEKNMKHLEGDRGNSEEVHSYQSFAMKPQEGLPASNRIGTRLGSGKILGDSALGDFDTQHLELGMDSRRSPAWILLFHGPDELAEV